MKRRNSSTELNYVSPPLPTQVYSAYRKEEDLPTNGQLCGNGHPAGSPRPVVDSPGPLPSSGPTPLQITTQTALLRLGRERAALLGQKTHLDPEDTFYPIWAVATFCISFGIRSFGIRNVFLTVC